MKKMLSAIAAVILAVSLSAGSVMAAGSKTAYVNVVTTQADANYKDQYVARNIEDVESFRQLKEDHPAVAKAIEDFQNSLGEGVAQDKKDKARVNLIDALNAVANDPNTAESIRQTAATVVKAIEENNLAPLTDFFDLDKTGEDVHKTADGKYEVTLEVPSLTDDVTTVEVLHFSTARNVWELISVPESAIDRKNKTITVIFDDLSPVMILCNASAGGNVIDMSGEKSSVSNRQGTSAKISTTTSATSAAKSPKTEDTTGSWMGFAVAAIALAGAGVLVIRRKRA